MAPGSRSNRLWPYIVAGILLSLVVGWAALVVSSLDHSGVDLRFHRIDNPEGEYPSHPIIDLSPDVAKGLPGNIPDVLDQAAREGDASVFVEEDEMIRILEAFHADEYVQYGYPLIRYQGTVFEFDIKLV